LASIFTETDNVHKWVHYLAVYESTLAEFRSRPIRMLEIGVSRGGSLQMWRRYLHPESVIVGIDIDPERKRFDDLSQQVHVRVGGQQDIPCRGRPVYWCARFRNHGNRSLSVSDVDRTIVWAGPRSDQVRAPSVVVD
jgi:hypothetical protein